MLKTSFNRTRPYSVLRTKLRCS